MFFGDEEGGDVLLVGWGSTWGPIREATIRGRDAGQSLSCLHIRHLNPLPEALGEIFSKFKHVVVPEMNDAGLYGQGQLATLLRSRYCNPAIASVCKTDGLGFQVREILAGIERLYFCRCGMMAAPAALEKSSSVSKQHIPQRVMSTSAAEPEQLTKKALTADHPTWCPRLWRFRCAGEFL